MYSNTNGCSSGSTPDGAIANIPYHFVYDIHGMLIYIYIYIYIYI